MTEISSLPEEVLLHIFSLLPNSDLITVWKISKYWRHLSRRPLATWIHFSLTDRRYNLSDDEMDIAADLVTTGYLSEVGMKILATRIQGSWSRWKYLPSVAEVRCAAALAATGHLTPVEYMNLGNLDLTGIKNISSLAIGVRQRVELRNVTGDVGPLLSSLTCSDLWMTNMELNQAATCSGVRGRVKLDKVTGDIAPLLSSLTCPELVISYMELNQATTCSGVRKKVDLRYVTGDIGPLLSSLSCTHLLMANMELDQVTTSGLLRGLQHGVKGLELWGGVRLHINTLVEYDGRGWCGEVKCYCYIVTADSYWKEIKTWAERINWDVGYNCGPSAYYIVMKRK